MSREDRPLTRTTVAGYALGSLGTGLYSTVPTVLLLYFCTEILLISPAIASLIVFVPKAWAILWDPIVGAWSDRARSSHGRRAPFLAVGAIGMAISFPLLFASPSLGPTATVVYVSVTYFAMATLYSLFAVPYCAVPAELGSAAERERLLLWRMVLSMTGVLIGAGVAPHLVELMGGGKRGYTLMALLFAVTCGIAMFAAYQAVRRRLAAPGMTYITTPMARCVRRVLANGEYVQLWIAYLLATSGVAMFLSMVPYYVTYLLQRPESDAGTALMALLAGNICALPLWGRALRRWDGWSTFLAALVLFIGISASFWFMPATHGLAAVLPFFFLLGVPFAGLQLLPFALLAHLTNADAADGGRNEGLYTGVWTSGEKLALALGPAVTGLSLAWSGYVSGAAVQADSVLRNMHAILIFGPALFLLPTALLVAKRAFAKRTSFPEPRPT
ncbi:MAG: MFS transporter [Sinobacteraceae bacterium]|nr:MFS transporter [Nevskiaceae bacterium]